MQISGMPSRNLGSRSRRPCYRLGCISVRAAGCQSELNAGCSREGICTAHQVARGFANRSFVALIQCRQEPVAQGGRSLASRGSGYEVHGTDLALWTPRIADPTWRRRKGRNCPLRIDHHSISAAHRTGRSAFIFVPIHRVCWRTLGVRESCAIGQGPFSNERLQ